MNIQAFLTNLASQTSSKETLRAYRQDLAHYEDFLRQKGLRVTQAKASTIGEFVKYLNDKRGGHLAPATISRRLTVVSEFYEFLRLNSNGKIANPVKLVKRPKVDNAMPRAAEDQLLASLIDGITNLRDSAMVVLLLDSGLRLSELRQLNKDSITFHKRKGMDGQYQYWGSGEVVGKGRKRRRFMVGPAALSALREYLRAERLHDSNPALFLSQRRRRISTRTIEHALTEWCKKLGLGHIGVHTLRHSFATRNVNAGMSAVVLQELLGHSNLATTQRYFRVKPERLAREYFAAMEFIRHARGATETALSSFAGPVAS
jgi:site-specific recombinase XerD